MSDAVSRGLVLRLVLASTVTTMAVLGGLVALTFAVIHHGAGAYGVAHMPTGPGPAVHSHDRCSLRPGEPLCSVRAFRQTLARSRKPRFAPTDH